jgi:hypothetical protein
MGFMAGVVIYLLILLIYSKDLTAASKTMPVVLCIFSLILILVKALITIFKKDPAVQAEAAEIPIEAEEGVSGSWISNLWKNEVSHRTIVFVFWLLVFGLSVQYIGFLVTTGVGLMALFITTSKISVRKSAIITAGTLIFVYLMFITFLNVRFPDGLFY